MTMAAERTTAPMVEFRNQLEARNDEFAKALPQHIRPLQFQRTALTAVAVNPKLLDVDRRSLLNALMKCAHDGLRPDGREAVLVIFKSKDRGPIAQYLPMVAGIRKLVQQSGEITRFEQTVVHAADEFTFELGDQPFIRHRPALTNRGEPVLVYSVAQWRDGTLSREVMTVEEIEQVRARSRSANDGPWVEWWEEMARKTVAKRHAKVLPMSNDAADALARDDEEFKSVAGLLPSPERRPRLADRLDGLAPHSNVSEPGGNKRRRGRHANQDDAADMLTDQVPDSAAAAVDDGAAAIDAAAADASEQMPDDKPAQPSADFLAGCKDRLRGATACLNREITESPPRLAEWERGFRSTVTP